MKKEKTKSREFIFLKSTATFFAHLMPVFYTIQLIQAFSNTAGTIGAVSAALLGGAVIDSFGVMAMMICSIVAGGLGFLCIGISEKKSKTVERLDNRI